MNMFRISLLLVGVSATFVSGCSDIGRKARVNPAVIAAQRVDKCPNVAGIGADMKAAIDLDCYRFPGDEQDLPTAYRLALTGEGPRNRLEAVLLKQADAICEREKGLIFANEAGTGLFFDTVSSGLSGAGAIVGGETAKSILSALASFSTATRSHITSNVYKNQIVPAITNVIDAERRRIATELVAKRAMKLDQYAVDQMIWAVNSYHQACSFQNGVQLLLKASQNKAGTDAILKDINLRAARVSLTAGITAAKTRPNSGETMKALEDKLLGVELEHAANLQDMEGEVSTADVPKTPPAP
jgi:hypothetical protein